MGIKTLSDLTLQNKRVLLRCDLNVPIKDGVITDDGRIVASLGTIRKLLAAKCSIILVAHLGRPKGEPSKDLSLAPIAKRLGELLNKEVEFSSEITGQVNRAHSLKAGQILMLENIRFISAETSKDEQERNLLAKELSTYADVYVGDGFGAVHRKHASVYELAKLLPHVRFNLQSVSAAQSKEEWKKYWIYTVFKYTIKQDPTFTAEPKDPFYKLGYTDKNFELTHLHYDLAQSDQPIYQWEGDNLPAYAEEWAEEKAKELPEFFYLYQPFSFNSNTPDDHWPHWDSLSRHIASYTNKNLVLIG
ncbi:MAG: phosphoglycerate kinase, partial [Actinobacteria bacterium]|nr:phosphoglycerate kinase [Actinomycetota bacterium]